MRISRTRIGVNLETIMQWVWPAPWEMVALASLLAGIGSGWWVLILQPEALSPFVTAAAMLFVTYAGWYVWGFFIHLNDVVLFGGHSDYRGTLDAFGRAYAFQALFFLSFTEPLGWLWVGIALYATVAAWGLLGPRRLGMQSWQALVAGALGMLLWLACLLVLALTLVGDTTMIDPGAFLARFGLGGIIG